eukprot:TRINITY_DN832_c0_g1_i6.p1 TRINITY_DN832_c0_g1~~TRINITY_DN832_c0_g1_i6.p1  ORF type:complete len:2497 (+),score=388.76 TRINITY_DN832_c0_g1_i6:121-7611(+)
MKPRFACGWVLLISVSIWMFERAESAKNEWKVLTKYLPPVDTKVQLEYNGTILYLQAAYAVDFETDAFLMDSVYILTNLDKLEWEIRKTTGEMPERRDDYGAVIVQDKLYLYAGFSDRYLNDFYSLDLKTFEWKQLRSGSESAGIGPCRWPGLYNYKEEVYLFSGKRGIDAVYKDAKFDAGRNEWVLLNEGKVREFNDYYGSAYTVYLDKLYAFGGKTEYGESVDEAWIFDLVGHTWTQLNWFQSGGRTNIYSCFSSHVLLGNEFFIFSGLTDPKKELPQAEMIVLNLDSHKITYRANWEKQIELYPFVSTFPTPRIYSSLTFCNGSIILIGGDFDYVDETIYILDPVSKSWTKRSTEIYPQARSHAASVKLNDTTLIMFGGLLYVGRITVPTNDVWMFALGEDGFGSWSLIHDPRLVSECKGSPPPMQEPIIAYLDGKIYLAGKPKSGATCQQGFILDIETKLWSEWTLPRAMKFMLTKSGVCSVQQGDRLIVLQEEQNKNGSISMNVLKLSLLHGYVEKLLFEPDYGPVGRTKLKGFLMGSQFCTFSGFREKELHSEIWCADEDLRKWVLVMPLDDSIQVHGTSMTYAGLGIIAGGMDKFSIQTNLMRFVDFEKGVAVEHVLPDIRPTAFSDGSILLMNQNLVLFASLHGELAENRVFAYDIGKAFCEGETVVEYEENGSLEDGSGIVGYFPFSSCSWKVSGISHIQITGFLTNTSKLELKGTSDCLSPQLFSNGESLGQEVILEQYQHDLVLDVPGGQFELSFSSGSALESADGFQVQLYQCLAGFGIVDGKCTCSPGRYITPSFSCYACPEGTSTSSPNQKHCHTLEPTESPLGATAISSVPGSTTPIEEGFPICKAIISTSYQDEAFVLCFQESEDDSGDTSRLIKMTESAPISWEYVETSGAPPVFASGFCAVMVDGRMIILGGVRDDDKYAESMELDIVSMMWIPSRFPRVQVKGHACTVWNGNVVIHGGEDESSIKSEIMIFGKEGNLIQSWQTNLNATLHTIYIHNNELHALGGSNGVDDFTGVHVLSLEARSKDFVSHSFYWNECSQCRLTQVPCYFERQMHSSVYIKGIVFVYGGVEGFANKKDLLLYDADNFHVLYDEPSEVIQSRDENLYPPALYSHSSVVVDGRVVILGGIDGDSGSYSNKIWSLDTETKTWVSSSDYITPRRRRNHLQALLRDRYLFIHGGFGEDESDLIPETWIYDTRYSQWQQLAVYAENGETLPAISGGQIVSFGDTVYVFGGKVDSQRNESEVFALSLQESEGSQIGFSFKRLTWTEGLESLVQHPLDREGACAVPYNQSIIIWGGKLVKSSKSAEDYRSVYIVEPATGSFRTVLSKNGPTPRWKQGCWVHEGKMCVYGGLNSRNEILYDTWCFDAESETWSRMDALTRSSGRSFMRYDMAISVIGDYVFSLGGLDRSGSYVSEISFFNMGLKKWQYLSYKQEAHPWIQQSGMGSSYFSSSLLIFGGSGDTGVSDVLSLYKPGSCSGDEISMPINSVGEAAWISPVLKYDLLPTSSCIWVLEGPVDIVLSGSLPDKTRIIISTITENKRISKEDKQITVEGNFNFTYGSEASVRISYESMGSLEEGFEFDPAFTLAYGRCQENAYLSLDLVCLCRDGFALVNGICDDASSRSAVDIGAIVGGCLASVVVLCTSIYFGKKYRDNLALVSQNNKKLYMAVSHTDITLGRLLGSGSFGEVYAGTWRGTDVAIKKLVVAQGIAMQEFEKELNIMVELRHPNVVLYMAACLEPQKMCIISELMSLGSLYDILHNEQYNLNYETKIKLLLDAANGNFIHNSGFCTLIHFLLGMNYLHLSSPPILHRDLKSPNLLLDERWCLKISDFGMTGIQKKTSDSGLPPGTLLWMAPEIIVGDEYTPKADIYSYGVVMWEVLTRRVLYEGIESTIAVSFQVSNGLLRPDLNCVPEEDGEVSSLMQKCWSQEPEDRPLFSAVVLALKQLRSQKSVSMGSSMHSFNGSTNKYSTASTRERIDEMKFTVSSSIEHESIFWDDCPQEMEKACLLLQEMMKRLTETNKGYFNGFSFETASSLFSEARDAVNFSLQLQTMAMAVDWSDEIQRVAKKIYSKPQSHLFSGLRIATVVSTRNIDILDERRKNIEPLESSFSLHRIVKKILSFVWGGQILVTKEIMQIIESSLDVIEAHFTKELILAPVELRDAVGILYEILPTSLQDRDKLWPCPVRSSMHITSTMETDDSANTPMENNQNWKVAESDIEIDSECIGKGSYGAVYAGLFKGKKVAVKRVDISTSDDKSYLNFLSEAVMCARLSHDNVIQFMGACTERKKPIIVMEFAQYGTLEAWLSNSKNNLDDVQKATACFQIADAINYLHTQRPPIIHRDLKPSNILVTSASPLVVKICDFGFARIKAGNRTMTKCGTHLWMAPEVIRGAKSSCMADMYSYGIIVWQVLTRQNPHTAIKDRRLIPDRRSIEEMLSLPQQTSLKMKDIVKRCTSENFEDRLTAREVVDILRADLDKP